MKQKFAIIFALFLVAAGAAAWWYNLPAQFGWTHKQSDQLTLYGNIDIRQVRLGFRVGGRIAEMLVDEGDAVKTGALLAHLDARPYEDAVRGGEAQEASLRATLDKLVAGPRPDEIAEGRAANTEQKANLLNAQKTYDREAELRPTGAISQSVLDQATMTRDAALARKASTRDALELLIEGTRAEDLAAARANLQVAQASLSTARTSLNDTELRAPDDGVILSRVREPGAILSPTDDVLVLSLDKPVVVRAYISESDLGRIHPGMTLDVTSDSLPDHVYRGTVGFISPVAEFTPKSVETPDLRTDLVYRLRIIIENADPGLRQGMPVTVHVPLGERGARSS